MLIKNTIKTVCILEKTNRSDNMTRALWILIGLLGVNAGIKMYQVLKIMQIDIDNMSKKDIEELVQDKRFLKYNR